MRPLAATPHGVLDYIVGVVLLASPWLFGFNVLSDSATYTMVSMGASVLLVSLITNYPMGLVKTLPFPIHGIIETIGAIALIASPWLLKFTAVEAACNEAIIVGLVYLAIIALTNYNPYQATHPTYPHRKMQSVHR